MAKPEWGRKVTCASCGNKFYDMRRDPATCPSCGAVNDPLQAFRPKRGAAPKPVAQAAAKPKAAVVVPDDDEDDDDLDAVLPDVDDDVDDTLEDDEDDDLIEDTADLGEDEDDLEEVREHIEGDPVKE